ncbi:hypothetical protein BJ138DRAFT_1163234 [Hygrophoropsis aurantiaca]|uniref:Uncharacterized protein n=1 Tax=Hygrophoropsis aurantiaca TaxID=72124 RepID=A0ACB7ZZI3_9AGAM|nr:hypothetical protein BJ138DRAFT_1163234 [Hygrophoropsis aurantiaca]
MFISRILSLLALSMLAAAACNLGFTEACCVMDPGPRGYSCLPFYDQCPNTRKLLCCGSLLGDGTASDCYLL